MGTWDREIDVNFRGWLVLALFAAAISLTWIVLLGKRSREEPARCPSGFHAHAARCCAPGQAISDGHCVGKPQACPPPFLSVTEPAAGCVYPAQSVLIQGGSVTLGPVDWDSADIQQRQTLSVRSFLLDNIEVTEHRYAQCISSGDCPDRPLGLEPGAPMTGLSVEEAMAFCKSVRGRLPTAEEWIFASAGSEARRYPWGAHGLVCRRASFGLVDGPCGQGGTAPELAGLRPDGRTPEGVLDLAGNVAEWTRSSDGQFGLHGGSYRSKLAGELKNWSQTAASNSDATGFRCAYDYKKK